MRPSRIIRYPIDIISVLVVLSTLSLQVFALIRNWPWYARHPHCAHAPSGKFG